MKYPSEIFLGAYNSRYIVQGVHSRLGFLDVRTGDVSSVPVSALSDNHISFDGVTLKIVGSDSRLVTVNASTPYTAIVEDVAVSHNGKRNIQEYSIINIFSSGVLLTSSKESFISWSSVPLFTTKEFSNPVVDNSNTGFGRLWYLDGGVQHVVDVSKLCGDMVKNLELYKPSNSEDTIAVDIVEKRFNFIKNLGEDFYLVERGDKKLLLRKFPGSVTRDGVEDRTSGDIFDVEGLEHVLSSAPFGDDYLFYTSIVGDDTHDGRIDDSDARLYLFHRDSGVSKCIGSAVKVVVSSSK